MRCAPCLILVLLVAAASARADEVVPRVRRPLVLPPRVLALAMTVEANLTIRETGEPLSLAPDVELGLGPRLTVEISHSARAVGRIDSGDGLCLSGTARGCARPYDNLAVAARYRLRAGDLALAARLGLEARALSPFKPALSPGVRLRARRGRVALWADPHVAIGLHNNLRGNRSSLELPVSLWFAVGDRVTVALDTGARGELVGLGEKLAIPVGAGLHVALGPCLDLSAAAGFSKLLGPQNTFKQRHLAVTVSYRVSTAPPRPGAGSCTAD